MADETPSTKEIRWFAAVTAIGHIVLLVIGAVCVWDMGGGWWIGALGTIVYIGLHAGLFLVLLAPGSSRRLAFRERILVNLLWGSLVVIASGFSGLLLSAVAMISVIIACDALDERSHRARVREF